MAFFSIRNSLKIGIEISEKLNFWSENLIKYLCSRIFPIMMAENGFSQSLLLSTKLSNSKISQYEQKEDFEFAIIITFEK